MQQMFKAVVKMVRSDKLRCAAVGIETDSTILPDEQKERQDRMQFLSSMGAFLQQAGPMAMQFPDMRGLLGGIMMFTLRTFSASRPLEKEFESFQKKLEAMPPTPPPGQGDNGQAAAQSAQNIAGIKAQTDTQIAGQQDQTKRYEIDQKAQGEAARYKLDHDYRMAQLQLQSKQVDLERQKLGVNILGEERAHDLEQQRTAVQAVSSSVDNSLQRSHEANQAELDRQHEGSLEGLKQEYAAEQLGKQQAHDIEMADKPKQGEPE
jgi:hypothetical protein